MHPFQNDVLDRIGKVIGYTQVYLFTILLMYVCYTFRTSVCIVAAHSHSDVCLGTVALTLIMLILSISLAVGISLRQAKYLLPWLIMSIVTVVSIIIYLIAYGNLFLAIMGSLILFLVILSWYPSLKLYQRYRAESQHLVEETLPLNWPAIFPQSSSLPDYSEVVRDPLGANAEEPPSYDEIMGVELKPLYRGVN